MSGNKNSISLVYLNGCIMADEFSYLHRYLHPGILSKDRKAALLCTSVSTSAPYLLATILVPEEHKGREIHLQHSLVVAVLELASHETQLGFLQEGRL